jgi:long-chain fatty acid transport protein
MTMRFGGWWSGLLAAVVCAGLASEARAGGLYFNDRGVRPLARGGAMVAGADDPGSAWYNPAGIYDSETQLLVDASWLNYTNDYTRTEIRRQVDPNTGQPVANYLFTHPSVHGSTPVLPLPTLAATLQVHRDWALGFGIFAPSAAVVSYPDEVDGRPAPQRYSLITLDGSALAIIGAGVGWKPHPMVRVGAAVEMLVGKFVSTTMFSSCIPDRFFCAPEQPEWDTLAQLNVGPIVAPSGTVGLKVLPHKRWKLGASFQLPFWVRAPATVQTRLPKTPAFERAVQDGENVSVAFNLPWSVRAGVQFEPVDRLLLALDGAVEGWAMHDQITVTPKDLALRNVVGFPNPYTLPTLGITRNFQNTGAVRFGGEYGIAIGKYQLDVRGGFGFESTAIPRPYLSALTVDGNKFTTSLGLGLHVGKWRFDAVYAHIFVLPQDVDPSEAASEQVVPVAANQAQPHVVNAGHYEVRGNVIGLGLSYKFDRPQFSMSAEERAEAEKAARAAEPKEAEEKPKKRKKPVEEDEEAESQ